MTSESPPAAPEVVVAAVAFVREGRLLTVRKRNTARFMLVGGKPEPGESPREAAVREAVEEIGVVPQDLRLLGEWRAEAANEPGHVVVSTVFTATLPAEPVAAREIAELRWLPLHDSARGPLPDDLAPLLRDHVVPALTDPASHPTSGS